MRTNAGLCALSLEVLNTGERVDLAPLREDGGFEDLELQKAAAALRDPRTQAQLQIAPRLLSLLYVISRHFEAKVVRVVSCYREKRSQKSAHGHGRAIDFVIPGVPDGDVARFARGLGFVGVGLYPTSGFVHLDSRERSYFWIDSSAPGQRTRASPVLGKLAAQADARAVARGETAPDSRESEEEDENSSEWNP